MADRFDVVAVEVTQKDRVVGRVVLRPQPGQVQDLRMCGDGSGMNTVDRRAVRSGECHVHLVERAPVAVPNQKCGKPSGPDNPTTGSPSRS